MEFLKRIIFLKLSLREAIALGAIVGLCLGMFL